jgi:hypothetical protein
MSVEELRENEYNKIPLIRKLNSGNPGTSTDEENSPQSPEVLQKRSPGVSLDRPLWYIQTPCLVLHQLLQLQRLLIHRALVLQHPW